MKNYIKLFGFIALVAVIGFSMIACDDDSGSDSIVGTWTGSFTDDDEGTINMTVVVKADGTGTLTQSSGSGNKSSSFEWTQDGSNVTFTLDDDEEISFTFNGGNTVTIGEMKFTRK